MVRLPRSNNDYRQWWGLSAFSGGMDIVISCQSGLSGQLAPHIHYQIS
jgi:hypothetical protein